MGLEINIRRPQQTRKHIGTREMGQNIDFKSILENKMIKQKKMNQKYKEK